jgi:GT2 family glycosyltransferase
VTRPAVSVVVPFAGDAAAARLAAATLRGLQTQPGDELILVDNGDALPDPRAGSPPEPAVAVAEDVEITVLRATAERSPAYARNIGAEHASNDWILFLDADCRAPGGLLDRYFADPIGSDVGALAGEVTPAQDGATVVARYGAARGFLSQEAHLAHRYLPRAVAANLLVRRSAFVAVGGFLEGLRAAEDTDFSWRLQRAGWRLELCAQAGVEHAYRSTLGGLRRQWRGYAAGRAWLGRRYEGFTPEPAVRRLARGGLPGRGRGDRAPAPADAPRPEPAARASPAADQGRFLALDALLAAEELRGLLLSNRPATGASGSPAEVVLVAERFPAPGDPLVEFAVTLRGARVEASARPDAIATAEARGLRIAYREDDGLASRIAATLRLARRHPLRLGGQVLRAAGWRHPSVIALAPAAIRLERDAGARLHALGGADAQVTARRLAALTGRSLGGEP